MKPCAWDSHELYERLIGPLREEAHRLGYALAVHGTLVRDIDLIAVPWIKDAAQPEVLAEALRVVAERVSGFARNLDAVGSSNPEHFRLGCPGGKPHGRRAWTFHLSPENHGGQ